MVEKRSTLTLGQKIGSKNKELGMSSDARNQLLQRQQKLKVSQKDKILEEKQRQEEEKKRFEAEKRAAERKLEEDRLVAEAEKKRLEQAKTETTKKFVKKDNLKREKLKKDFNDKKSFNKQEQNNNTNSNKRSNDASFNSTRKENNSKKDFKGNNSDKNNKKDGNNNFKKDNRNNNSKNEIKKPVVDVNLVEVKKENTFQKKNFDRRDTERDFEERKNRKIDDDSRMDQYIKNIHTYVFNDEMDAEDILQRNNRNSLRSSYKPKKKQNNENPQPKIYKEIKLPEMISVSDLADRMGEKVATIVKKLFTMGMAVTANQIIDADTAELVTTELGHKVIRVSDSDVENVLKENEGTEFVARSPVVTVMGHVDHGKTSLLDALRSTHIADRESGGITQHIGASRIEVKPDKFITFIDTPGHEAFTEMRMRGANITDIVILVVAADDGIKDQTIEAINHTKAAGVPMIVAINKIDKEGCNPDIIKSDLLQHNVVLEEFGGDVMCVEVSAKTKLGLDKLIDTILLQAEMLDLKAPIDCKASGAVIEGRMDLQKGPITTLLVQKGILKIGDIVVAGTHYGRVKKMLDDKRKNKIEASPSICVEVLGLNSVPNAGDTFNVVTTEKEARDIISYRERKEKEKQAMIAGKKSFESMLKDIGSNKKQLSVIVKGDVTGSIEAIINSLSKLSTEEASVSVVHFGTGMINESDVNLASVSNALIIGFNVRSSVKAVDLAKAKGIEIRYYSIIYNIIDDVKDILSGLLDPIEKEELIGQAEVRKVFNLSTYGTIAGCMVINNQVERGACARLVRDGIVVYTGKIKSVHKGKEDVKEVKKGLECGIGLENYSDIKEKDIIECFKITESKREL